MVSRDGQGFGLRLCRICLWSSNPVAVGLLIYIVLFQNLLNEPGLHDRCSDQPSILEKHGSNRVAVESNLPRSTGHNLPPGPVVWKPFSKKRVKLPYPIFVPSLPKSGTTSLWKYFVCGGQKASHAWITRGPTPPTTRRRRGKKTKTGWSLAEDPEPKPELAGLCIHENIQNGKPPFHDCGEYDVFTDTGYINYNPDKGLQCFFPGIDGLEAIYNSYPNATILNVVRETEAWYTSLKQWSRSSLFLRFRLCNATNFPNGQSTRDDFYRFYEGHTKMIRRFAQERPSLTYLEVKLEEDIETPRILEEQTGIRQSCWKHCRPQEKECYLTDEDDKDER